MTKNVIFSKRDVMNSNPLELHHKLDNLFMKLFKLCNMTPIIRNGNRVGFFRYSPLPASNGTRFNLINGFGIFF